MSRLYDGGRLRTGLRGKSDLSFLELRRCIGKEYICTLYVR